MNEDYTFTLSSLETIHLTHVLEDAMQLGNPMARHALALIKEQINKQDNDRHGGLSLISTTDM